MLCDGGLEVNTRRIEFAYEDGAIPEVIDYFEKNIASETMSQLKVRTYLAYLISLTQKFTNPISIGT